LRFSSNIFSQNLWQSPAVCGGGAPVRGPEQGGKKNFSPERKRKEKTGKIFRKNFPARNLLKILSASLVDKRRSLRYNSSVGNQAALPFDLKTRCGRRRRPQRQAVPACPAENLTPPRR